MTKTNAMRLLDAANIKYQTSEYEHNDDDFSGVHVAEAIGMPPEQVFKTLVAKGDKTGFVVFCIPVAEELDMKKAACVSKNKSVELLKVKDLLSTTGYIRGGCSPIGMKKPFPTYIDETAIVFDEIAISAGIRGQQIILDPEKLIEFTSAVTFDAVK